jgi:hypothetical protein
MLDQPTIEQLRIAVDERIESVRAPSLHVHRHEVKPGPCDRLVILVLGAVQSSDVPDSVSHDLGRFLDRIQLQVFPRELEMLAMTEATPSLEDRAKGLNVTLPHATTVTRAAPTRNETRSGPRSKRTLQRPGCPAPGLGDRARPVRRRDTRQEQAPRRQGGGAPEDGSTMEATAHSETVSAGARTPAEGAIASGVVGAGLTDAALRLVLLDVSQFAD